MKLRITIYESILGAAWRVYANGEHLIDGLSVQAWTLREVVRVSIAILEEQQRVATLARC